jgi:hypothetical protein
MRQSLVEVAGLVALLLVAAACGPAASAPPASPAAAAATPAAAPAPAATPAAAPAPAATPAAAPAAPSTPCPLGTLLTRGAAESEHESGATWCARPDGTKHGRYVAFWEPGKKAVEGDYAAGKRVGRWTRFFRHGEVVSEELYRDGEPDGVWVAYSLRRIFAFATCFDRGRRVWQVSSAEVSEAEARGKPCP